LEKKIDFPTLDSHNILELLVGRPSKKESKTTVDS
jgi:hypothetical protein